MTKDLKDKAIDIKGKDYVMVKDRIIYFNENFPKGCIHTEILTPLDSNLIIVRAKVFPETDNRYFVGHSQAIIGDGYINKTAALENAETSAVGRALAMLGIGVLDSVASVDEMNKANNAQNRAESDPFFQNTQSTTQAQKTPQNAVQSQSGASQRKYPIKDYGLGNCNSCGTFLVHNPKTGKNFCQAMCFLKNKEAKQDGQYDNHQQEMDRDGQRTVEHSEIEREISEEEIPF